MIKACYIHIPFCENICSYCDFSKIYKNEIIIDRYLDSLEKEINNTYKKDILETIYIGGGTPSCLNIRQLKRLFNIIDKLNKSKNIEYTIEGNFESTTKNKLLLYKEYGINRLSFGIESISKNNLKYLERELDIDKVKEIIKIARELNFNNINLDLIYAIPKETIEILEKDLEFIFKLDVEHISTYSLIIESNTKLYINKEKNIDEDKDYEMYKFICDRMRDNNYKHYEISNFSKDKYYSKHNLTYWNNNNYYGFGLGASSYIDNKRITNTRSINLYLEGNYNREIITLKKKDIIEYEVILNLRKREGIDLLKFKKKYNEELINYYDYRDLVDKKILVLENNNLFIDEEKWYISNGVILELLGSGKDE